MKTHLSLCLLLLGAACVPAPAKTYSTAEIGQLESLEELMRVLAATADPLFGKTSFSDEELAQAGEAAQTIEAAAARVGARFGGQGEFDDGFVDFAKQVETQAQALGAAAGAKDGGKASEALTSIRSSCAGCHGVYR
ncbi:MAG: hypothetical protein R3B72_11980 [Polyangiaceae bacterium]